MALTKVSYSMIEGAVVNVQDYGVVGDGTTNDATAFGNALAAVGTDGGAVYIPNSVQMFLDANVTIPQNVKVVGDFRHTGNDDVTSYNFYDYGSQIKLGTTATITISKGSSLENLLIIRAGLPLPATTDVGADAVLAAFTGTAINGTSATDASIISCMILGHATAVSFDTSNRIYMDDVFIDSLNGVLMKSSYDVARIHRVHCWPFLTAYPGHTGGSAYLRRSGYGFKFETVDDWTSVVDCFAYGYSRGFWASSVSNVQFLRCQADYTNPNTGSIANFVIDGTSAYCSLIGCFGAAGANGLIVDTTGGGAADSSVKVVGSTLNSTAECIIVNNGNVLVEGCAFHSGTYGVYFAAGADDSSVVGCLFDGVATDLGYASTAVSQTVASIGNSIRSSTESTSEKLTNNLEIINNQDTDAFIKLTQTNSSVISAGDGPYIVGNQPFTAGSFDSFKIKGKLIGATPGAENTQLVFSILKNGVLTESVMVHEVGALAPVIDNTVSCGLGSYRWTVVYAATGTINTSDGNQKQDTETLNVAEKRVAARIKGLIKKFRFKDAVTAKGDNARIHVGVIAQDVKAAFEAEGLDATKYGMFCSDTLEDGSVQLGIRYDELFAFIIGSI